MEAHGETGAIVPSESAVAATSALELLELIDTGNDIQTTDTSSDSAVTAPKNVEFEDQLIAPEDNTNTAGLMDLPDEIILHVMQYLGLPNALNSLSGVNHRLHMICHDESLWRQFEYTEVCWTKSAFTFVFETHGTHFTKLYFSKYSLMLSNLTPLRYIENHLGQCHNLTHLDIQDSHAICTLQFLGNLPNLTYLNCSNCPHLDPVSLPFLTKCEKLTYLNISHCPQFLHQPDAFSACCLTLKTLHILIAERSFYLDVTWVHFLLTNLPLWHLAITPVYRPAPIWEEILEGFQISCEHDLDSLLLRYHGHCNSNYIAMYPDHNIGFFQPLVDLTWSDDDEDIVNAWY